MSEINTPSSESIDIVDMFLDEFIRIKAILANGLTDHTAMEINGLCERAQKQIKQRVPVIEQRDRLERELIQAQQTIAQQAGQIHGLREAADYASCALITWKEWSKSQPRPAWNAQDEKALSGLQQALSTPAPVAVVPNYVNVAAEVRQQLENEAPVAVVPWEVAEQALSEIVNLQAKLAAMEPEGWEGSKRRMALKAKLQSYAPKKGNQ